MLTDKELINYLNQKEDEKSSFMGFAEWARKNHSVLAATIMILECNDVSPDTKISTFTNCVKIAYINGVRDMASERSKLDKAARVTTGTGFFHMRKVKRNSL